MLRERVIPWLVTAPLILALSLAVSAAGAAVKIPSGLCV